MKSQINLTHLKFFCDAVIYCSISEAAKLNYVSQSAVSQAIVKLEQILGVPLIVHSRQKFQVTEEGKLLFEHARSIFKSVQDVHEKIAQSKNELCGRVKFVTTKSLCMSYIASFYKEMTKRYPSIDIQFQAGGLNFIRSALKQGEAEFAIVVYDDDFQQFAKYPLKQGLFHLYQLKDTPHNLLEKGILVDYASGTHVEDLLSYGATARHTNFTIQRALSGWEITARFTDMGIGVGFLPDYIVKGRYPNLVPLNIDIPPFHYEICLIHMKAAPLSRAANAVVDIFRGMP